MRFVCQALLCATLIVGAPAFAVTPAPPSQPATISGGPTWAKPESDLGFAPLTITQSGVTYSPAGVAENGSGATNQTPIADLPAWGTTSAAQVRQPEPARHFSLRQLGNLPTPATWALLILGFGLIGGATRGLLVANRRLKRLQDDDDPDDV